MERDACWAAALNQGTAHLNSPSPSPADSEFGMGSFSLSPIDFEPLPNLFFNSTTSATYKDFPVYKTEKNPHDVADVLLSLKHAVVHPGHQVPLPPLSPLTNYSQYTQPTAPSHVPTSSVSYTMHHPQAPMMSYNQFPPSCLETAPQHHHHQTPPGAGNVFPSMSVNVSMNMTMGMAGMNYNVEPNPAQHHQVLWNHPSGPSPQSQSGNSTYPHSSPLPPIHMSYSTAGNVNHPNNGGYSFTAEFRPGDFNRDVQQPYKNSSSFHHQSNKTGFSCFSPVRKRSTASVGLSTRNGSIGNCPDAKNNMCRICGKAYARPSTLKTHLRTHSGEKPYRCSTCNKSFSQAANLTAHIRTHSGEKPFRCPICDRRFSQSSSVTTHMRTHSGERPYRCRLCKKAFSDSSTLTKHVRIHSGEKPYQCRLCLLRFSQSGNLNRHMRIHSGAG